MQFLLRNIDHNEMLSKASVAAVLGRAPVGGKRTLDEQEIGGVFGIDIAAGNATANRNRVAKESQIDTSVFVSRPLKKRRQETLVVSAVAGKRVRPAISRRKKSA